jgi:hypothetical protein
MRKGTEYDDFLAILKNKTRSHSITRKGGSALAGHQSQAGAILQIGVVVKAVRVRVT